jgi:hypothetical protein
LDRLIEKIRVWDSQSIASDFEKTLRSLFIEGKIDMNTLNILLASHREEVGE